MKKIKELVIETIYTRLKLEEGLSSLKEIGGLSTKELLEEMKKW